MGAGICQGEIFFERFAQAGDGRVERGAIRDDSEKVGDGNFAVVSLSENFEQGALRGRKIPRELFVFLARVSRHFHGRTEKRNENAESRHSLGERFKRVVITVDVDEVGGIINAQRHSPVLDAQTVAWNGVVVKNQRSPFFCLAHLTISVVRVMVVGQVVDDEKVGRIHQVGQRGANRAPV